MNKPGNIEVHECKSCVWRYTIKFDLLGKRRVYSDSDWVDGLMDKTPAFYVELRTNDAKAMLLSKRERLQFRGGHKRVVF